MITTDYSEDVVRASLIEAAAVNAPSHVDPDGWAVFHIKRPDAIAFVYVNEKTGFVQTLTPDVQIA